jgi:hypothetical protein
MGFVLSPRVATRHAFPQPMEITFALLVPLLRIRAALTALSWLHSSGFIGKTKKYT